MAKPLKKLSESISVTEDKALNDFLTISTRMTDSPRETESQLLMSLSLATRRIVKPA